MKLPLLTRVLFKLARDARGKNRMTISLLRWASSNFSTPSVYGPLLRSRWHDMTFLFCVGGSYGRYLSDFLREVPFEFSFLDIGANIGLYSLVASSNPGCHHCYAFEPNPIVYNSLLDNIALNERENVRAYNVAISSSCGVLRFAVHEDHTGGGAVVDESVADHIAVKSADRRVFDEIAKSDRLPKIVKIDVEGHEPIVFQELRSSSIWPDVRYIFCEIDEERFDAPGLVAQIEQSDFRIIFKNLDGNKDVTHYDLMFERQA
jgi:FkbM family methyltransferase